MENQIIDHAINILLPVIESAIVLAGEYSKKCGRTVLTSQDMNYAIKYCARNVTGNQMGTLFPEIDLEEDDDPTEEELETVDEEEEPFTRYSGDDNLMNAVNESQDAWEGWEPQTPMEKMLKEAVDKNMY
jgi:hypothetical protein